MATLEEMRELERKYGDMEMRLAIAHLFYVGIQHFSSYANEKEIEDEILASRAKAAKAAKAKGDKSIPLLGEGFEIDLCLAAWEISKLATPAEIICWCERREYFSIFEWENYEEDEWELT